MPATIRPFLMFEGKAWEAMQFYCSLFPGATIDDVVRYGPGEQGPEGSIKVARFTITNQTVMCIDSPAKHAFTFTPSFSFFVDCVSEPKVRKLAGTLGEGGAVLMPVDNYGFSKQFAWVADRYGVSWQLNLP